MDKVKEWMPIQLNQIYNIDRVKINLSVADKNYNFYKNILQKVRQLKKELMPIQLNQIYIIDNKTTRIATVKNNLFIKIYCKRV